MTQSLKVICILIFLVFSASCGKQKLSKPTNLLSAQGQVVNFPDPNKTIILNFWASWCAPCRDEIHVFNQLQKRDDVLVVGVNVENLSSNQLLNLIQEFHIQYPILLDDPHQTFKLEAYPGVPATYILTKNGEWKEPLYGKQTEQSLLNHIDS